MRTDKHSNDDELIDVVVSLGAGQELSFLTLTSRGSADVAIMSPKFEQVVRQTADQIIQTTFSKQH